MYYLETFVCKILRVKSIPTFPNLISSIAPLHVPHVHECSWARQCKYSDQRERRPWEDGQFGMFAEFWRRISMFNEPLGECRRRSWRKLDSQRREFATSSLEACAMSFSPTKKYVKQTVSSFAVFRNGHEGRPLWSTTVLPVVYRRVINISYGARKTSLISYLNGFELSKKSHLLIFSRSKLSFDDLSCLIPPSPVVHFVTTSAILSLRKQSVPPRAK